MFTVPYTILALVGASLIATAVFNHTKTNWKIILVGALVLLSLVVGFYHGQSEAVKDATLEWVAKDGTYAISFGDAGTHLYE